MDKEYIDREALINAIPKPWAKDEKISQWGAVMDCIVIATSIPVADVASVVHGEWIETKDDNKKRCSRCDVIHLIAQYPNGNANYCPNCGAKMEGVVKNAVGTGL